MKFFDLMLTVSAVLAFFVAVYLFASDSTLARTNAEEVDAKLANAGQSVKDFAGKTAKDIKNTFTATSNWKYIVIHNSGTRSGNAAIFDRYHREDMGMSEGLAYHFVIGNGTKSGDGEVETGRRWTKQMPGEHCWDADMNRQSIGICLVGDFNKTKPTHNQIEATAKLVGDLCRKYQIPPANVTIHKEVDKGRTDCPGKNFQLQDIKSRLSP